MPSPWRYRILKRQFYSRAPGLDAVLVREPVVSMDAALGCSWCDGVPLDAFTVSFTPSFK